MGERKRQSEKQRLRDRVAELERRVAELETENATLRDQLARAKKNATNSSKPPSSDIVKPKKPQLNPGTSGADTKRKIGGQPGHVKHERPPFDPSEIDHQPHYTLDSCPDCGNHLHGADTQTEVVQQVEIIQPQCEIIEHIIHQYRCKCCDKWVKGSPPKSVDVGGLVGPELTSYIAYLRGSCRLSIGQIRRFLIDTMGIRLSTGMIAKVINKATEAMDAAYQQIKLRVRDEDHLNIDETGHKDNGARMYTWAFCGENLTLFHIGGRSCAELIEVLGEDFDGVIGCDLFSAYTKFMGEFDVELQLCLAHLIRDLKFLSEHPRDRVREYGRHLLESVRELFRIIHRRDTFQSEDAFREALLEQKRVILTRGADALEEDGEAWTMAKRMAKHGESYFTFITTPGIDPTNNAAERALRFIVIHRKITQGTRGEKGRRWWERYWTISATCQKQGRSVCEFIREAVDAYFSGQPPALIFASSE